MRFRAKGVAPSGVPMIYCTSTSGGGKDHGASAGGKAPPSKTVGDVGSVFKAAGGSASGGKSAAKPAASKPTADAAAGQEGGGSSYRSVFLVSGAVAIAVGFVLWRGWSSGSSGRVAPLGAADATPDGRRRAKKVMIVADDGREHTASLSLDGLSRVPEVREALAELAAEILEVAAEDLLEEDLMVELRDDLGRKRPMVDEMSMSAVLRAASIRCKLRGQSL